MLGIWKLMRSLTIGLYLTMVTYGHCPYHTSSGDFSADFGQFNFLIVATLKEQLVTKAMPPHYYCN